jgi:hypothetical protein
VQVSGIAVQTCVDPAGHAAPVTHAGTAPPPAAQQRSPAAQLVAVHAGTGGTWHVITPPPPPPPPKQAIPIGHGTPPSAVVQTVAEPMGQVVRHVRAPPPPPPPAVQQTMPGVQLVAVQFGVTHVPTPPAATQV